MARFLCKDKSNPEEKDKPCITKLCRENGIETCCAVMKTFATVETDAPTDAPTEAPTEVITEPSEPTEDLTTDESDEEEALEDDATADDSSVDEPGNVAESEEAAE